MNEKQKTLENLVYTLNAIKKKKEIHEAPKRPLQEGIRQLRSIIQENIEHKSNESIKKLWLNFGCNFLYQDLKKYTDNWGIVSGLIKNKGGKLNRYVKLYVQTLQSFNSIQDLAKKEQYGSEDFGLAVFQLCTNLEIMYYNHEELEREVLTP